MTTNNPWQSLISSPAAMYGRRVDAAHPRSWFWCVDPGGNYGLALYEVSERKLPHDLSEMKGLSASIRENSDGSHFLLLLLLGSGIDWELFRALCEDVVESTAGTTSADNALDVAITRLRRWQRFLSRGRRPSLTDEEARGLLAELIFLNDELRPKVGIEAAVQSWTGPRDYPQDFAIGGHIYEVKSRLPSSRQIVEITSAEQLESSSEQFFLVVQELTPAQAGAAGTVSLAQLVESVRRLAESIGTGVLQQLDDLLEAAGYEDDRRYGEYVFLQNGRRYFHVTDKFPRIIRSRLPAEILRVRYALDVSQCTNFEVPDPWA